MPNHVHHQEKIDQKLIQKWRHYVRLRWFITLLCIWLIGFFLYKNQYLLAGATFFGAAVVVSLQNFVSSFFAYIYLTSTAQFEEGDIIKTWNPFMSVVWEVRRIGFFFTTVKEVDTEMLFTWRIISFPNNLVFSGWIFNYTRKDLLFWHEFSIYLWVIWHSAKETINTYRTIVMKEYYKTLHDDTYYLNSQARDSNPKFDLKITEKWVECKTRVLVHFYKLLETNNALMTALLDEHKKWTITLITHKDYDWIE
jgi:Mechanosensitive ion channel